MILDPAGDHITQPIQDEEGIIYGEIDTALSIEPKQFHDVVGYYNRFDIFSFSVDRSQREPAQFHESKTARSEPGQEQRLATEPPLKATVNGQVEVKRTASDTQ